MANETAKRIDEDNWGAFLDYLDELDPKVEDTIKVSDKAYINEIKNDFEKAAKGELYISETVTTKLKMARF